MLYLPMLLWHQTFCLVCFCFTCMANLKKLCQLFKNSTIMLCEGVFHSISNRPTNLTLFTQAISSSPKLVQSKNILQITIIILLCWSQNMPNLIILISTHFLPMQICNHCSPICSLRALLIGNMNFL
jgi:hypothetical protein